MEDVLKSWYALNLLGAGGNQMLQSKFYVDGSGNVTHVAYAYQGADTSVARWRICKLVYDGSGNLTNKLWSRPNQVADNYASLAYT